MTTLNLFKLERYFSQYEFSAPYILSASDCESLRLADMLAMADPDSLSKWENLSLGYTESPGNSDLREEIARLYTSLKPDQVLVMAPEECIYIAMHTLLFPGDEVIAISPAYQSLHEIARSIGCTVISWQLAPFEEGWQLDLNQLRRSISQKTKLLIINFPHNPTGYLPPVELLEEILSLARRHSLYVFSDEMYRLLEYEPSKRLPAVCDLYELGISLSGMSKTFALPGLRIGWLGTRAPGLVDRWQAFKDYTTICNSAPSEILALIGLRSSQRIIARSLEIIQQNLAMASQYFGKYSSQFHWHRPQAGSVSFCEWTGPGSVENFCQNLIDQQGVMLVPGSLFDYPGQYFRLGLGRKNFGEALERVDQFLTEI